MATNCNKPGISFVREYLSSFFDMDSNPWLEMFVCLGVTERNAHHFAYFSQDVSLELELLHQKIDKIEQSQRIKSIEEKYCATYLHEIFIGTISMISAMISGENHNTTTEKLEDFLRNVENDGCHIKCLKEMKNKAEGKSGMCEAEIQAVLACHLFSPLLAEGDVMVDKTCYKNKINPECPFCKDRLITGNTNYGCRDLWHGKADIVIKSKNSTKIVKVRTGDNNEEGQVEPANKRAKLEDTDESTKDVWNIEILNDKADKEVIKADRTFKQMISQTIVNAFLVAKENKALEKHFIPSFLVTNEHVCINFYNVKEDILLSQFSPFKLFKRNDLDFDTVFSVWLALNFDQSPGDFSTVDEDYYKKYLAKSGFKDLLIKSGVLEKYQTENEYGFLFALEPKSEALVRPKVSETFKRFSRSVSKLKKKETGHF